MATEMCTDPPELVRGAITAQAEAQAMTEDLVTYRGKLALFDGAFGRKFGNSTAAGAFQRYNEDYQAAMVTAERLVTVLEEECDALMQTAFVCQAADQLSASELSELTPDGRVPA